jgi:hypothetical protein
VITPEDEARYKLPPMPDVPLCGPEEAERRREAWKARLAAQRAADGLPELGVGQDRHGRPTR